MKLDRLRYLMTEVDREFAGEVSAKHCYYFHQDVWHEFASTTKPTAHEQSALQKAHASAQPHRSPKSRDTWFPLSEPACVVRLQFPQAPYAHKRNEARDRLSIAAERALNAFKVAHNPLTMLLARDAFRSALENAIIELSPKDPVAGESQDRSSAKMLAVLALDIDHFKQINDYHGHPYGDCVLRAFAVRLEHAARDIELSSRGTVKILLGHPSGEEFLVMIFGDCTVDDIGTWCERFRSRIADTNLPDEGEWNWLTGTTGKPTKAPPIHERIVRASIGVARYSPSAHEESAADAASEAINRADIALYRAKSGGRNRVVAFEEVALRWGRVLEQDAITRVIAIDIGSNVGVLQLQEFRVYTERFTGHRKLTLDDGRTSRTIGTYPRVPLTQITVFDVQPEVSFAFISDPSERAIEVPVGSHIEALPFGSITGRPPYEARYFPTQAGGTRIGDIQHLHDFVAATTAEGTLLSAAVVRASQEAEYKQSYGSAALNSAIARLFRDAQATFHAACKVGVLDVDAICIVGPVSILQESSFADFFGNASQKTPELGLIAGSYFPSERSSELEKSSELNPRYCIEYAKFAISPFRPPGKLVTAFSHNLAANILENQRKRRQYLLAEADFEKLEKLGVVDGRILNGAGLIQSALGRADQALALYERAVALSPDRLVYRSNCVIAANRCNEIRRGLLQIESLSEEKVRVMESAVRLGFSIYGLLLARAKLENIEGCDLSRLPVVGAKVLALKDSQLSSDELSLIQRAIAEVEKPTH